MNDNLNPQANGSASASLQFQTNPPPRILVVDHDPYIRHLSADVLIRHGYEVNAAEDAAAGWEELQTNNYNLLITEQDLPRITGVKLVRKLRAARMALPIVLVARRLPVRELARNPSLRLAATLLKPLAVDVLVDTVKIVLRVTGSPCGDFAQPSSAQAQPSADFWRRTRIAPRARATPQVLEEIRARSSPYSHWGLNE
jgi:DNA-binding response OmpR family regulator